MNNCIFGRVFLAVAPLLITAPAAQAGPLAPKATLPRLAPQPGYIIGRAVFADGRPMPQFTVSAVGYDGQVNLSGGVPSLGMTEGHNGRYALRTLDTFRHQKPVSALVIGVTAVAKIMYQGQAYRMEMYPLDGKDNGTGTGNFRGRSGKGVVRDFVLRMTGVRPSYHADEETESRYRFVYYGGVLQFDGQRSSKPEVNYEDSTALVEAFPTGTVEITLTPQGPLLDGSAGQAIQAAIPIAALKLGGNWRQRYLRNIPLGVYAASARLRLDSGETRPLHIGKDSHPLFSWHPSLSVTWTPDKGPSMQMPVDMPTILTQPTLYLGQ